MIRIYVWFGSSFVTMGLSIAISLAADPANDMLAGLALGLLMATLALWAIGGTDLVTRIED